MDNTMKKIQKRIRIIGFYTLLVFTILNILAFLAVYIMTSRASGKLQSKPTGKFTIVHIKSNVLLEAWHIKVAQPKGTFIIFHGYRSTKEAMLDKSDAILTMGYNVLLVDFMGAGNSAGNQVTIGYKEAKNVKDCYDYIVQTGEQNVYLLGASLGAVAIMKAIHDYKCKPKAIILECPFGTMREAIGIRLNRFYLPAWGLSDLMLFWGSIQNGFWAFSHNPIQYAGKIHVPTLLLYGAQDIKVTRGEIDAIFKELACPKTLTIFPKAGHESYLNQYAKEWKAAVGKILSSK